MTAKKVNHKNNKGTEVISYQGRYITVTGLSSVDIQNIGDVCTDRSIKSLRNQEDLYEIVLASIAQSDQEIVSRNEIDADVEARFDRLDHDDQEELIDSLDRVVDIFDIPMLERVIEESVGSTLEQLADIELIKEVDPTCELDQAQYHLTTVGKVLSELAFGTDHTTTIRINHGTDA